MAISIANRGKVLEKQIFLACDWYAARALALIQQIPTEWKVERKNKKIVKAFPAKKSTVDFLGIYNGQGIAIEAKEEETDIIDKGRVKPHQQKFLKTYQKCGGLAYVVVSFWKHNRFFRIPADRWINYPALSFSIEDCAVLGTELYLFDNKYLDFLELMKAV